MNDISLNSLLKRFEGVTENPVNYLLTNSELTNELKSRIKEIYEFSKSEEQTPIWRNSLCKLIIKDFDLEQIWQQINLKNEEVLNYSVKSISKLLVDTNKLTFNELVSSPNIDNSIDDHKENESELSQELSEEVSDREDDVMSDDSEDRDLIKMEKPKTKGSVVDDEFFKLSEMEEFLKKQEMKTDFHSGNDDEDTDNDDSNINLFETDSEDENINARMAKFKDYFVANEKEQKKSRNKIIEELEELETDGNEEEHVTEANVDRKHLKSNLEVRQERLKRRIEDIEEKAIREKPWQLKGEVTAENRPQNSLLEDVIEFDLTSRPAPVITEQTSLQLEDIIKQRIKDKVFDSVERKVKPVETPLEYKKKLVLDQEKSKQSLAQIYEKEYLEHQAALDPENREKDEEEPDLHKEVKQLMMSLFNKLDALSNFHFTSKPSVPELKIISNLPAISVEDVAPVATSDAALLAPEEVKKKLKGDTIGKSERSKTDKKRDRRKKKLKQKIHKQLKEKKEKAKTVIVDGVPRKYGVKKNKSKIK